LRHRNRGWQGERFIDDLGDADEKERQLDLWRNAARVWNL
jgi:hypothetical protein